MRFLDCLRELIAPKGWQTGPVVWQNCWPHSYNKGMPVHPAPGEHVLEAKFSDAWGAVMVSRNDTAEGWVKFMDAFADAGRVGFVLGGGTGLGHGVYADGPARIVVTAFEVLP